MNKLTKILNYGRKAVVEVCTHYRLRPRLRGGYPPVEAKPAILVKMKTTKAPSADVPSHTVPVGRL